MPPNPAVGSNIGNVYQGRQGTGFATVLPWQDKINADLEIASLEAQDKQLKQAAEMEKQKRLLDAHKKMTDKNPDYWYRHDQEIQGLLSGWTDLGGSLMAGDVNPWENTDEGSITFQKLGQKIEGYANASKQLREEWAKTQAAYTDPKERENIENWDEIVQFYNNPSIVDIVENGKRPPQPVFKQPEIPVFEMTNKILDSYRKNNPGKVMSPDDAKQLVLATMGDGTYSEGIGGGYYGKQAQLYNEVVKSLPEDQKESFAARGMRNGGLSGFQQFAVDYLLSFENSATTFEDIFLEKASKINTKISDVERGDVTEKRKYVAGGDDQLRKVVKSTILSQPGLVSKDILTGKYGDPDKPDMSDFNLKAAEKYYLPILRNNVSTEYSRREAKDETGSAKEDMAKSREMWRRAVKGELGENAKQEAIDYLTGIQTPLGEVTGGRSAVGGFQLSARTSQKDVLGKNVSVFNQDSVPTDNVSDESLDAYYDEARKLKKRDFKYEEGSSLEATWK